MERSVPVPVRLIGGLHVLGGALTILGALCLGLVCLQAMVFGRSDTFADGLDWGVLVLGLALVVGGVGAGQLTCGVSLIRGRPWARIAVVCLSLLSALTALGLDFWPGTILPLSIAGYLALNANVARAFRA
jgi:hypothetical protein